MILSAISGILDTPSTQEERMTQPAGLSLWETSPAQKLSDAYLIGNGRLGAVIYGSAPDEKIAINEDSFWSGSERGHINHDAKAHLAEARRLVFEGKFKQAERLVHEKMLGTWGEAYEPLMNLRISMDQRFEAENIREKRLHIPQPMNYLRSLDIDSALTTV